MVRFALLDKLALKTPNVVKRFIAVRYGALKTRISSDPLLIILSRKSGNSARNIYSFLNNIPLKMFKNTNTDNRSFLWHKHERTMNVIVSPFIIWIITVSDRPRFFTIPKRSSTVNGWNDERWGTSRNVRAIMHSLPDPSISFCLQRSWRNIKFKNFKYYSVEFSHWLKSTYKIN